MVFLSYSKFEDRYFKQNKQNNWDVILCCRSLNALWRIACSTRFDRHLRGAASELHFHGSTQAQITSLTSVIFQHCFLLCYANLLTFSVLCYCRRILGRGAHIKRSFQHQSDALKCLLLFLYLCWTWSTAVKLEATECANYQKETENISDKWSDRKGKKTRKEKDAVYKTR